MSSMSNVDKLRHIFTATHLFVVYSFIRKQQKYS